MSPRPDDPLVITEGPLTGRARLYHWVLDHLAKFPGRVTAVTFAAGVVVTVAVVLLGGDGSVTTVVSLVATLWALFFAVMIYLLTARDTDTVLEQIADLHEQLSTALAAPGDEEEDEEGEEDEGEEDAGVDAAGVESGAPAAAGPAPVTPAPAAPAPATPTPAAPAPTTPTPAAPPPVTPTPAPTPTSSDSPAPATSTPATPPSGAPSPASPTSRTPRPGRTRGPGAPTPGRPRTRVFVGPDDIAAGVPRELLDAWTSATGHRPAELARAWTRDPRSDRQWVLETAKRERWVVFSKGDRGIGVLSLEEARRRRR